MRGGYRPGAGRKKGGKNTKPAKPRKPSEKSQAAKEREQIRKLLATGIKAKAKIYQDFLVRISKNEALTIAEKKLMAVIGAELEAAVKEDAREELKERIDPLEYGISIVSDPAEPADRRDRMAIAILPYLHPRKGEGAAGKKDQKADRAKTAGAGKFAPSKPPLALVK